MKPLSWTVCSTLTLTYIMFFPTKEAPDHPTNVFDQASEGGLHFGSESGVGAELEKNSAPMASATNHLAGEAQQIQKSEQFQHDLTYK